MSDSAPTCQTLCLHPAAVSAVQEAIASETDVLRLAETFKLLADATRLRIVLALRVQELCVCDLSILLGMSQSAISHQLRYLRAARLVRFRKEGKNVFYALDDDHVDGLLNLALDHVHEE